MTRHLAPINWIQWLTLIMCAVIAVTIPLIVWRQEQTVASNQVLAEQAHLALCEIKTQDEQRIASTKAFLHQHPNGIPGISRAVLLRSVHITEAQLEALKGVDCTK